MLRFNVAPVAEIKISAGCVCPGAFIVRGKRPGPRPGNVEFFSADCQKIRGGSHLVSGGRDSPGASQGHTTSTCFSPELECYVSLALLEGGFARQGERLFAANPLRNSHVAVEVVNHHMVDKDGGRMRG